MEMRAESPIAGVSSDEEGCDDVMKDCVEENIAPSSVDDIAPSSVDDIAPNQCGTSNPDTGTLDEITPDQTKVTITTAAAVVEHPDTEIPNNFNAINVEAGKRRVSLCEEVEETPTKKTRHADYSCFKSISVVASNGNVILLPQIPPEIFPAAPATIGGLLSAKMIQLSGEAALKRTAKEKQAAEAEMQPPRQRTSELWVNKYAPKSFLHLLSDERCNRNVLQWLKSWDPIVFGKARPSNAMGKDHDSGSLPESKIMLLNGPPGVGKTTLVHILARQAGYMPMEINASDERSTAGLKSRLEALTETQSLTITGASGRPICVILDEIDGTVGSEGQGVVGILLKLAQDHTSAAKKKKSAGEAETEENADGENDNTEETADKPNSNAASRRRKVKAAPKVLRRPIICICNDLYATALRPLRPVAQIVRFTSPSPARLIARLQDICKGEGIKMNRQALTVLYEMHHGDIRACVTALQMIAVEPALDGMVIDVANMRRVASMTSRDGGLSSGIFDVWTAIFDQSAGKHNPCRR